MPETPDRPNKPTAPRRRSGWGESSITKDDTGRWHGYVSMGLKDNGRRDRRHVRGVRRADVVAQVRELERQRDAGTAAAGRAPTVAEWLDHWVKTIAAPRLRYSTLQRYEGLIARQLVPKLGHHRLDRLRPEHIERAWAELSAAGYAPATVLQAHRVLSRALKVAMQRGRLGQNPATLVDAPAVHRAEVQPLAAEDARRVLSAASSHRNGARWAIALALGLRQGEALGLPWDAVDLEAGTLRVRQALQRQKGHGLVIVQPKSLAGRRTIALPDQLVELLLAHKQAQADERVAAGTLWQEHGLVFTQVTGKPLDPGRDYQAWHRLLQEAGVPRARLHDARHTAATTMLSMGVPARVAMQVLGHSQIGLTLGTYSHVAPELALDAAQRVGQALWGQDGTKMAPPRGDAPSQEPHLRR